MLFENSLLLNAELVVRTRDILKSLEHIDYALARIQVSRYKIFTEKTRYMWKMESSEITNARRISFPIFAELKELRGQANMQSLQLIDFIETE